MMKYIKKWSETSLILRIILGLIVGTILALTVPQLSGIGILGDLFVGILKAIAPFLVFFIIMSVIPKTSSNLGSRFKLVITLYLLSMMLAAIVSVTASFLFPVSVPLTASVDPSSSGAPLAIGSVFSKILTDMISNPVTALIEGKYISILFWAIVFGLSFKKVASENTLELLEEFSNMISHCVRMIIQLAPFGIMGIIFKTITENGLDIFISYGQLLALIVGCVLIVALVTDPFLSAITLRRNPYPLVLTCIKESGITAFFTRSSAANIPVNLELCRRLGLDENFYGISIPLGSTINMEGAAITITIMTLATCHSMGIAINFPTTVILCIITVLAACGASGIAGGSLLLIPMACSLFGISQDISMHVVAIGFIIGVVQDSFETALNSAGDAILTSTAEYKERMNEGRDLNFLGEFAK